MADAHKPQETQEAADRSRTDKAPGSPGVERQQVQGQQMQEEAVRKARRRSRRKDLMEWLFHGGRNDRLFDLWSLVHLGTGILMAWVMDPFLALLILVLWEPLEVFVLSPIASTLFGVEFGFESLRNVMSDIVFDSAGVAAGYFLLRRFVDPPFTLFAGW